MEGGGSGVPAASVGTQLWVWKAGNKPRRETPSSSVSSLSPTRQNRRAWRERHQGTLDPLLLLHSCGSKGHLGSRGGVLLPAKNHTRSSDCSRKLSALPPKGLMVSAQYQGPAVCRQIVQKKSTPASFEILIFYYSTTCKQLAGKQGANPRETGREQNTQVSALPGIFCPTCPGTPASSIGWKVKELICAHPRP